MLYMNVLVVGDVLLDINHFSTIHRNAPEALHIPVNKIEKTEYKLGGAANLSSIIHKLGIDVTLLSITGNDIAGKKIKHLLTKEGIKNKIFLDETRKSPQKNRIFFNNTLVSRFDMEDETDIESCIEDEIIDYISKTDFHIIVLSDYNKGLLTASLTEKIIHFANVNNIYTFVDPKSKNPLKYRNCYCLKPNMNEAAVISGMKDISDIMKTVKKQINCQNLIITSGEKGVYVNDPTKHFKIKEKIDVVDVTGCGDLFLGIVIYGFITEFDLNISCEMANYFASLSTTYIGNGQVSLESLKEYRKKIPFKLKELPSIIYDKDVYSLDQLSNYQNIVFTNGCFDILHSAHIQLLKYCKSLGNILIVGLNSDDSIRRLKGNNRPINDIYERSLMLSLLDFVDYIIVFEEDTPYNIIKMIMPDIIVKGGDYKKKEIVGSEFAKRIELYNYIDGKSTTNVIKKINTNKRDRIN